MVQWALGARVDPAGGANPELARLAGATFARRSSTAQGVGTSQGRPSAPRRGSPCAVRPAGVPARRSPSEAKPERAWHAPVTCAGNRSRLSFWPRRSWPLSTGGNGPTSGSRRRSNRTPESRCAGPSPFDKPDSGKIAIKVITDNGDEVMLGLSVPLPLVQVGRGHVGEAEER